MTRSIDLPVSLLFDHPTPEALVRQLAAELDQLLALGEEGEDRPCPVLASLMAALERLEPGTRDDAARLRELLLLATQPVTTS